MIPQAIAIALIWEEGRVLVARRRDDAAHLPGVWEFPGGKCEEGESPGNCAVREVREEIGVEIEITGQHAAFEYEYSAGRVRLHPFNAKIVSGCPCAVGCSQIRWLWPHELNVAEFPPANAALIAKLQNEL